MTMSTVSKRKLGDLTVDVAPPTKKMRVMSMDPSDNKIGKIDEKTGMSRTSNLNAPTMMLEGHKGPVYSCRFSPDGVHLASGGADRDILIWHVYGECENHTTLKGHTNSVVQVVWGGGSDLLFSASADHTAAVWDVEYGVRLKKIRDHSSFVNSICPTLRGQQYFATASDDGSCKIFDLRMRAPLKRYDATYQVTACALTNDALHLYSGGIDNLVKVWDGRKSGSPVMRLQFHSDTVTSLSLSKDQRTLLSNSMDRTLAMWNIGPFVNKQQLAQIQALRQGHHFKNMDVDRQRQAMDKVQSENRLMKIFEGAQHNHEKLLIRCNFANNDSKICSGSSDKMAYIFDVDSAKMEYKLPGHKGSVNEVDYHPKEPIILSCSSDSKLYLGEL